MKCHMTSLNWVTSVLLLDVQEHKLLKFIEERKSQIPWKGVIVWSIERHWPEFSEVGIARYLYCIKNQCWAGGDLIKLLILSVLLEDPSDETQELETVHSKWSSAEIIWFIGKPGMNDSSIIENLYFNSKLTG